MVGFRESNPIQFWINALDKLVLNIHYVKMPIGNGGGGFITKGRPRTKMANTKTSIVEVKAENNSLATH
jgi:hypothetical protein